MFIGHFAVGLASKRLAPKASLGALLAAPNLLDLLWPVFLGLGIEHARMDPTASPFHRLVLEDYPWSHSLLMSVVWSVAAGGLYFAARRDRAAALVIAAGVFSHWVLDVVTHRPDVPLYPGSSVKLGLDLWQSTAGTIAVESLMLIAGVAIYLRATRAKDRRGSWGMWGFLAFLCLAYVASIAAPPPPDMKAIVYGAPLSWLLIIVVPWWFDRHRQPRN